MTAQVLGGEHLHGGFRLKPGLAQQHVVQLVQRHGFQGM